MVGRWYGFDEGIDGCIDHGRCFFVFVFATLVHEYGYVQWSRRVAAFSKRTQTLLKMPKLSFPLIARGEQETPYTRENLQGDLILPDAGWLYSINGQKGLRYPCIKSP